MIYMDREPDDNRVDLLITQDRYRKELAVSAAVALVFAVCMIAAQGHVSVSAGVSLGSSALLAAGSVYHHQMRKRDLKGMLDKPAFKWTPHILDILFRPQQPKAASIYEDL